MNSRTYVFVQPLQGEKRGADIIRLTHWLVSAGFSAISKNIARIITLYPVSLNLLKQEYLKEGTVYPRLS